MTRTGAAAVLVAAGLVTGCGSTSSPVQGADAGHGRDLILHYGCGSCHTIGGIETANGTVGPRLTGFRSDRYIAGDLPNTPENAASWIQDPKRYEPGTIMPDLGVTAPEARDIVAYLLEH
ncbi:MAG TPA: c-type cytochrome [Solirubrobacteraceae bacterium]|nr:c-type cytochrome [Solirubrobacteraceae bacterium]